MRKKNDVPSGAASSAQGTRKKVTPGVTRAEAYERGLLLEGSKTLEFRSLKTTHKLQKNTRFEIELAEIWIWWSQHAQVSPRLRSQQRRLLFTRLNNSCIALTKSLSQLGPLESTMLMDECGLNVHDLASSIRKVSMACERLNLEIPQGRTGPDDSNLVALLVKLRVEYCKGFTGSTPPRVSNKNGIFSGPYFLFVEDLLNLFQITTTNASLGKAITKALDGMP